MGVFGTIWDIGEAAGPMIAGFLIGGLGYAATFDVLAAVHRRGCGWSDGAGARSQTGERPTARRAQPPMIRVEISAVCSLYGSWIKVSTEVSKCTSR